MGGSHHGLGPQPEHGDGGGLAFQPLRDIDDETERSWAADWIGALLAHENVTLTPDIKDRIWSALCNLATTPREERTLTGLSLLLQSNALRAALAPSTLEGAYGGLLDAADEHLADRKGGVSGNSVSVRVDFGGR